MKRNFCALAGVGFCIWQARDLFTAWRYGPFDRCDPLAFVLWVVPVVLTWARRDASPVNTTLLLAAAAVTTLGSALDLNVLQNAALAVALSSFAASRTAFAPWLLAAPAWWPAFGWAVSGWGAEAVGASRLMVAGAAAAWGCWLMLRTNQTPQAA